MAIILAKKNNQFNIQRRHFYIDDESDLVTLEAEWDCGIGDLAEMPNGAIFCRHSDGYEGDLWEQKISGGGKISGSVMVVTEGDDGKMTKSVAELVQAAYNGAMVVYVADDGEIYLLSEADDDIVVFQALDSLSHKGKAHTLAGYATSGEDDVWVEESHVSTLPYPTERCRYRTMVGKKAEGIPYEQVIVPEQTVDYSGEETAGGIVLQDVETQYIQPGTHVTLGISGDTYSTDFVDIGDGVIEAYFEDGETVAIIDYYSSDPNHVVMITVDADFLDEEGKCVAELTTMITPVTYDWTLAYPYDAVIRLSKPTVDSGNNTATLVQGDFDTLVDAIKDHPLHIGVFGYGTNYSRATTFMVAGATLSTGGPGQQEADPEILINVIQFGGLFDAYVATSEGGSPTQKAEAFMDMTRHAVLYVAKDAETGNTIVGWK